MEPPLLMALFHPYQLLSHRKVHLHFLKLYSDQKLVIGVDLRKKSMISELLKFQKGGVIVPNCLTHVFCCMMLTMSVSLDLKL